MHDTIDTLVAELTPVKPVRVRAGIFYASVATIAAASLIGLFYGVRADLLSGSPHPMIFVRMITFLLVGFGVGIPALSLARPEIAGPKSRHAWKWALAAAALLPLAALIQILQSPPKSMPEAKAMFEPLTGMECLAFGGFAALLVGTVMIAWMRQGAPTSPERAGILVGLAAGGFGAAAFSVMCPFNSLVYVATWHSLLIILSGLVGRLCIPRLLRW